MKEFQNPVSTEIQKSHRFDMTDRKKASLTGVKSVDGATSSELTVTTVLGKLEVKGSELKIVKFDEVDGNLTFTGNIDSVKYAAPKQSFIKRLFK
ncbi:MAG: YabP/YqfC family sporulation protein [Clostridiales bacterium]|nr:YabP/YqfC family sporulation protein [Clostridiales bacterium]